MIIPIGKIRSKRILVIGDLMLDIYLRGRASRISPEAPVLIVSAERQERIPGGASNVMSNLCALGCEVSGAGFLGNDDEGKFLFNALELMGVRTDSIITTSLPTIHKTRVLANGQHVVRFDFDTDFSEASEDKHLELVGYIQTLASMRRFDAVIISDYCKGTITQDVVEAVKKGFSCPVIVDTKPQHKNYFNEAWCITPNLDEAKQMVGHWRPGDDHFAVARTLKEEMSLRSIIITLADKGILLIDADDKEVLYDAYINVDEHDLTQRFDVTGAGDTVISVFAACVAADIKAKDAIFAANVAAGIVVSKIGTASCSYKELKYHLDDKSNQTQT